MAQEKSDISSLRREKRSPKGEKEERDNEKRYNRRERDEIVSPRCKMREQMLERILSHYFHGEDVQDFLAPPRRQRAFRE